MSGPRPRAPLDGLAPARHGGDAPRGVVDASTGVSPLAPPTAVVEAARAADLRRYPHPTAAPLAERLAAWAGVAPAEVVVGAGSVELVWALARAFGGPGRRALVVEPAFAEYRQALAAAATDEVRALVLPPPPEPAAREVAVSADVLDGALDGVALAFVARPGNPTLVAPTAEALVAAARRHPSTLLVVDEAYQSLVGLPPLAPTANLAVLRSLTKVLALPGLRLGALFAAPPVARAVQACLPPWNVSAPAQAAGLAAVDALAAPGALDAVRAAHGTLRAAQRAALAHPRARLIADGGTFLVYDVAEAGGATAVAARCLTAGARVRDCTSFGLPALVRVGLVDEASRATLATAWRAALDA